MAVSKKIFQIFKQGSTTYFYSSLLFPKDIRDDIFILYAFVRTADNFVDSIPQQKKEFKNFVKEYQKALIKKESKDPILNSFVNLLYRKKVPIIWVDRFLEAMKKDLIKNKYKNINETISYISGSAEVVGLIICKILDIKKEGYPYAKLLGRSMQYINFIRDIKQDLELNRNYFPQDQLKKYNLTDLEYETVMDQKENYKKFIRSEIERYFLWQKKAELGFKYIPKKYLLPIKTASDLYKWTASKIYIDPFIVYNKRVKPSVGTIITRMGINLF